MCLCERGQGLTVIHVATALLPHILKLVNNVRGQTWRSSLLTGGIFVKLLGCRAGLFSFRFFILIESCMCVWDRVAMCGDMYLLFIAEYCHISSPYNAIYVVTAILLIECLCYSSAIRCSLGRDLHH